ncbi:hypothetical protein [Syntrophotalea acetylenica]|uniref:hypothetical protein n=1 Tax=Syntrophotalea acetylenica TaxID=29542 RepID=UPI000AE1A9BF|nr:hypothetical protein [Syntrophotalea acetylenica]
MKNPRGLRSNFAILQEHDEQLLRLGMLAEKYFPEDPNTSILKLRQLAELLAQMVATKVGLYLSPEESQYDLLRRLQDRDILPGKSHSFSERFAALGTPPTMLLLAITGLLLQR